MHQVRELQSLAMHREIAERLRADPSLLDHARRNLSRWSSQHGDAPPSAAYAEWQHILDADDLGSIIDLITRDDEEARRLRQNSPLAGILTPREVWRIKKSTPSASHAP